MLLSSRLVATTDTLKSSDFTSKVHRYVCGGQRVGGICGKVKVHFDDPLGCVVLFYMMDSTLLLRYSTVTYFES